MTAYLPDFLCDQTTCKRTTNATHFNLKHSTVNLSNINYMAIRVGIFTRFGARAAKETEYLRTFQLRWKGLKIDANEILLLATDN